MHGKDSLDNLQIKKQLGNKANYSDGYKPSIELVQEILDTFWFHDYYNSFISDQINLDHTIKFLNKDKVKKFNRYDFYRYFFDQTIISKKDRNQLQKIFLYFECKQTDNCSLEDLSNISKNTKYNYTSLHNLHLIYKGEGKDEGKIFLQHHTLSEFLTAEYIVSQKDSVDSFREFAVLDFDNVTSLIPSWTGVLLFLLESSSKSDILEWLVTFLEQNTKSLDSNVSDILVKVGRKASTKMKSRIFNLIFKTYSDRRVWIPNWTHRYIADFICKDSYHMLKSEIESSDHVKKGNVIQIIDSLLEKQSSLVNDDREFWKKILTDIATSDEDKSKGVLKRNSMSALEHFKDSNLISRLAVSCYEESDDSLVRDAFMNLCMSAPNSKVAIDYFVKGIESNSNLYAKYGLYEVTELESLKYFWRKVKNSTYFWEQILEYDRVPNEEGEEDLLVKNLKGKISDIQLFSYVKEAFFFIFSIENIYQEGKSNLIRSLLKLLNTHSKNLISELLNNIKLQENADKKLHLFFDYQEVLPYLLTINNFEKYLKDAQDTLPDNYKSRSFTPIYWTRGLNNSNVYKKAVKKNLIEPVSDDVIKQERKRIYKADKDSKETYEEFITQFNENLNFQLRVFAYFNDNVEKIEKHWELGKKELFEKLVKMNIEKWPPSKFRIKMVDKEKKSFNWSTFASVYPDVIKAAHRLMPSEINKHRKDIFDFIPFAFSSDIGLILELLPEVKDRQLDTVNKIMSDPENDRRYLVTSTYIYLVKEWAKRGCKIPSVKAVILSFIDDDYISDSDQNSALEALEFLIDAKDIETKTKLHEISKSNPGRISETARELLIKIYEEDDSINALFAEIKIPLEYNRKSTIGKVHTPSAEESEINYMHKADPLIGLSDSKYLDNFLELLDYSFDVYKEKSEENVEEDYWEYVNYLWKIVLAYADNLKHNGSFAPLLALEKWVADHSEYPDINWLGERILNLRQEYINYIGRQLKNYEY